MVRGTLKTLSNNIGNESRKSSSLTAPTKCSERRSRTTSAELSLGLHQSEGIVRESGVKEAICDTGSLATMSTENAELMSIRKMQREFKARREINNQIMEMSQRRAISPSSYSESPLTVPRSPNMRTSARLGEKNYAIQGSMIEPVVQSPTHPICPKRCKSNSETPPLSLTVPEAFHLHTEDRLGRSPSLQSAVVDTKVTAELRNSQPHESNKSGKWGVRPLTIPKAPDLTTETRKRPPPMSSDEKDQMIIEEARHHPFHARPVPRAGLCGEHGVSLVHNEKRQKLMTSQGLPSRRKLTVPHSPNLSTKKRGAVHKDSKQQQLSESQENTRFKAIELPDTTYVPEMLVKPDAITLTDPQAFESKVEARVASRATWDEGNKARIEAEKESSKQKQEMEDARQAEEIHKLRNLPASEGGFMFKARGVEMGVESPNNIVPIHSTKPLTQPQTPNFATNTRPSRHCRK